MSEDSPSIFPCCYDCDGSSFSSLHLNPGKEDYSKNLFVLTKTAPSLVPCAKGHFQEQTE